METNKSRIVYHGTISLFDRFDLKSVGQGYGAAKQGHGFYLTNSFLRAKYYADELAISGKEAKIYKVMLPSGLTFIEWEDYVREDYLRAIADEVQKMYPEYAEEEHKTNELLEGLGWSFSNECFKDPVYGSQMYSYISAICGDKSNASKLLSHCSIDGFCDKTFHENKSVLDYMVFRPENLYIKKVITTQEEQDQELQEIESQENSGWESESDNWVD